MVQIFMVQILTVQILTGHQKPYQTIRINLVKLLRLQLCQFFHYESCVNKGNCGV